MVWNKTKMLGESRSFFFLQQLNQPDDVNFHEYFM